jgi:hypothetical protein
MRASKRSRGARLGRGKVGDDSGVPVRLINVEFGPPVNIEAVTIYVPAVLVHKVSPVKIGVGDGTIPEVDLTGLTFSTWILRPVPPVATPARGTPRT